MLTVVIFSRFPIPYRLSPIPLISIIRNMSLAKAWIDGCPRSDALTPMTRCSHNTALNRIAQGSTQLRNHTRTQLLTDQVPLHYSCQLLAIMMLH